jgi:hypothetical protein
VRGDDVADLLRRDEVTAHQSDFLAQCDEFDDKALDVRFFDQQPPARLKHAHQIPDGFTLLAEVMQRIDHDHAIETTVGEGQAFDKSLRRTELAFSLCLLQHRERLIADDHFVDEMAQL